MKHFALLGLLVLAAGWLSRYEIERTPYYYDEADYMFAASRGYLANWLDLPSLSLPQFVHIGVSRGSDPSQTGDLSALLRDSGDMDGYRHWHGPIYYYGLALAPADASEHTVRLLSLAAPLLGLAVIYAGCLWLWGTSTLGTLTAALSSLLFLWSPAVIETTQLAPHILFAAVCLAALFAMAKLRETGKRVHWYAALALSGVAFCTMELTFALILTALICGHLERDRLLRGTTIASLGGRSLAAFVAPVLLLWPAGLYKLNFIKSYLFMAYLAVFRKGAWGDVTFAQTWSYRFGAMPVEWAAFAVALILFFRRRNLPGQRELSVFLIFGAIMTAAELRVNAPGLRYVVPFFPPLMVFTGCVLAAALLRFNPLNPPMRWIMAATLGALVFVDTARQVRVRPPEPDRNMVALVDAIRDPRWQGKTLLVPHDDIPTLHFYFQNVTFRGYTDPAAIPARLAGQNFDGVVYPDEAAVRVLSSR